MDTQGEDWVYTLGATDGVFVKCAVTLVHTATQPNIVRCKTSNFGVLRPLPGRNINFEMICEALRFMLTAPAAPHLLGFTIRCQRVLWVKTFFVTLVCDEPGTVRETAKMQPWLIRILGQTLLLHFYHERVLTHILVTHKDHTQKISREHVGWIPCFTDLKDVADVDSGSCVCSTLRGLWTVTDRHAYFRQRVMPNITQRLTRCTRDVADTGYRELLLNIARHAGWILQGYNTRLQEVETVHILSMLPVNMGRDVRRVYPVQSMYRLTDCQGESRAEMYTCQANEEPMAFVYNLKQWLSWVDETPELHGVQGHVSD